jgi:drug/metabolite transporter (DMT)-like permease
MRPAHLLALVAMNVFWGASYTAFKVLTATLSPGEVATLRYGGAALLLAFCWPWLPGAAPRGRDLWRALFIGLFVFSISPRLQVLGVKLGQASDASVVVALEPLVTAVAAAVFLREHVPARRWLGFTLGMSGIVLLHGAWRLELQSQALLASLIFLSSFVCESAFSIIGKPILSRASPFKLVAVSLLLGTLLNLIADGPNAVARIPHLGVAEWIALAFLVVICTVAGYTLWYVVIRDTDVNLAALTILVQPLCGVLVAAAFVGERLHWGQFWGATAIVASLVVGLNLKRRDRSASNTSAFSG